MKLLNLIPKCLLSHLIFNYLDADDFLICESLLRKYNKLNYSICDLARKIRKDYKRWFNWNCKNGNLDTAKLIYKYNKIDIHCDNEYIFRVVCANGNLDIAKWLYNFGNINIDVKSNECLLFSCFNNHLNVVKWLISLNKNILNGVTGYGVAGNPHKLIYFNIVRFNVRLIVSFICDKMKYAEMDKYIKSI